MNIIIRLLTVSIMISTLAFGIAGYAGSKSRSLPLSEAIEGVQTNCTVMLQDIKNLTGYMLIPGLADPYYCGIEFSLPVAYEEVNSNPF